MKKFSKILCLVLVVVMMAGLCVVGTNAAFTDADKVTYKEAVDTLTAIGVIDGMGDNTFAPAGTLTRAQACKIITYLLKAEDIVAPSTFKDTKGHWAESYIAYCASEGIVAGVGNGKFDPDATLTGSAWAKMLLCAMGYDANETGMTGDAWEVGVAKLVKHRTLAAGVENFVGTAACNRETACQLAYNALWLGTPTYTGGTTTTVGGVTVTTGKTLTGEAGATLASAFTTLTVTPGTDASGTRTAHSISYKGQPVGAQRYYYDADETIITYTTAVTAKTIEADVKAAGYTMAAGTAATVAAATAAGVETVLCFNDGTYYAFYQINDTIVAAASVSKSLPVAATKTTGAYTTYTVAGSTYKIFSSVVNPVNDKSGLYVSGTFTAPAVIEGTVDGKNPVLTYTDAQGVIHICEMAVIKGVVSGASTAAGVTTYTIGGEKKVVSGLGTATAAPTVAAAEVGFYMDRFGNLATPTVAAAAPTYVALGEKTVQTLNTETNEVETAHYAMMVATDGTVKQFKIAALGTVARGTQYTMTLNPVTGNYAAGSATAGTVTAITAKSATMTGTGLYANAKTLFVFAEWKADGSAVNFNVKTVTGTANVGTYTIPAGEKAVAVDVNSDGIADIVVVTANVLPASTAAKAYLTGNYNLVEVKGGNYTYEYEAYVKGELTTITVKQAVATAAGSGLVDYTATTVAPAATTAATTIENLGGMLKIDAAVDTVKKVADNVPVYVVDDSVGNKTVNTYNFADIGAMTITGYVLVMDPAVANTVAAIYVTI